MKNKPLVSVIIPTYNYASFINQAVDSIIESEFPKEEVEIIVIDDGSTDNTSMVLESYKDRIEYIYQSNLGKAWATNIGVDRSQGKYIFNLDADDSFLPHKIQTVVNSFESDKSIVHVSHPAFCWNTEQNTKHTEKIPSNILGQKISGEELLKYLYQRNIFFGGGSTFAGRSEVIKKISIPKEIDMFIDEYLVLATLAKGYSFFIEEPLSIWRVHSKNYSNNFSEANLVSQKIQRGLKSREAVLCSVLESDLNEEIKIMYQLKVKVETLTAKEHEQKKTFRDILDIWVFFFKEVGIFSKDSFLKVKTYTLLNRSIPTKMIVLLKKIKMGLFQKLLSN